MTKPQEVKPKQTTEVKIAQTKAHMRTKVQKEHLAAQTMRRAQLDLLSEIMIGEASRMRLMNCLGSIAVEDARLVWFEYVETSSNEAVFESQDDNYAYAIDRTYRHLQRKMLDSYDWNPELSRSTSVLSNLGEDIKRNAAFRFIQEYKFEIEHLQGLEAELTKELANAEVNS